MLDYVLIKLLVVVNNVKTSESLEASWIQGLLVVRVLFGVSPEQRQLRLKDPLVSMKTCSLILLLQLNTRNFGWQKGQGIFHYIYEQQSCSQSIYSPWSAVCPLASLKILMLLLFYLIFLLPRCFIRMMDDVLSNVNAFSDCYNSMLVDIALLA